MDKKCYRLTMYFYTRSTFRFIAFYHEPMSSYIVCSINHRCRILNSQALLTLLSLLSDSLMIIEFQLSLIASLIGGLARMLQGCRQNELEFFWSQIYHAIYFLLIYSLVISWFLINFNWGTCLIKHSNLVDDLRCCMEITSHTKYICINGEFSFLSIGFQWN